MEICVSNQDNSTAGETLIAKESENPIVDIQGNDNTSNKEVERARSPSPVFSKTIRAVKSRIIDSDSSDEENNEESADINKPMNESLYDNAERNNAEEQVKRNLNDIIRSIVDSESSDESTNEEKVENFERKVSESETSDNEDPPAVKDRSEKVQRKSAKIAQENMMIIQSESQRMTREAELVVPYHRPRQCTLKEFLGRRNVRRPEIINGQMKQKSSIHMRGEELLKYAKHLEERAKEAELFFKTAPEKKCDDIEIQPETDCANTMEEKQEMAELITTEGNEINKEISKKNQIDEDIIENANKILEETNIPAYDNITEELVNNEEVIDNDFRLNIEISPEISVEIEPVPSTSKKCDELLAEYEKSLLDIENKEREQDVPKKLSENAFCALDDSEDELDIRDSELQNVCMNSKLVDSAPRLSGCPGMIIDLEEDRVLPQGVGQFMERFVKHAKVKTKTKEELPAISIETENKDVLIVDHNENEGSQKNPVPGLALKKLRNELQARMAVRRSEEFKKRMKQVEDEKSLAEPDILDDEFEEDAEEVEMSSSSEDEEEIEDEVEDVCLKETSKKKNDFLDDEAEVDEDIDDNDCEEEAENGDDEESEEENQESENDDDAEQPKKILRRIRTMDSSDSEIEMDVDNKGEKSLKRMSSDLFQSQDDNEMLTSHQTDYKSRQKSPQPESLISKGSDMNLFSPALFSVGSQNSFSDVKLMESSQLSESPVVLDGLFPESLDAIPKSNSMNKLFDQTQDDPLNSKCTQEELFDLCSGNFPTQQEEQTQKSQESPKSSSNDIHLQLSDDSIQDVLKPRDNNTEKKEKKLKKKKKITVQKLPDTDDEDSGKENVYESDLEEELVPKIYDYDSEENEIEVIADKVAFQKEARTFFEEEAELSESEWGSADEDEGNLDELEYEAGDAEVFDNKKIRGELERIHIRHILDEDKHEVRLLQELLLEDGENHGDATRERKFRWKNAENAMSLDKGPDDQDDEGNLSEEEDQSEWRKNRFEREKVLREKQIKLDEIVTNTGLIPDSLKHETPNEKKINLVVKKATPNPAEIVIFNQEQSFLSLNSIKKSCRGSFLKRDEATLSRLSALMRTNVDGQEATALASTSKGNFVFSTISPAQEKITAEEKTRKRAHADDISNISKKVKSQSSKKLLLDYLK